MRGALSDVKRDQIISMLPSVSESLRIATQISPGVDLHDLIENTNLGIALVCLGDAYDRFIQVRMALFEAQACLSWYRHESQQAPQEFEAALTSRFYLDHVGLLLYAIGEDISAFIVHFLCSGSDLQTYLQDPRNQKILESKSISSNSAKTGLYINEKFPEHEITNIIRELHSNRAWGESINYRNTWVHDQPPIIAELGMRYARESRIQEVNGERLSIEFGGGSEPEYTIDELLAIMVEATRALTVALTGLLEMVIRERQEMGEKFNFETRSISLEFS